jgi:hypothetical protein
MRGSFVIIFVSCVPLLCRRLKAYFCYHGRQIAYVHRCIGTWCVHMHPYTRHDACPVSPKSTVPFNKWLRLNIFGLLLLRLDVYVLVIYLIYEYFILNHANLSHQ